MGHIKIIAAILIWSSLGIFIRKIDLPNTCLIFYPALAAAVLQFLFLSTTGLLKRPVRPDHDRKSLLLLFLSPFCFIANSYLFYYAMRSTTIANAVLTHYTAPVFVALLAPFLLKEKIYRTTWLAIILSSLGLWLIVEGNGTGSGSSFGHAERLGIIAGTLSGLAYAFSIMIIREIARRFSSFFIILFQSIVVSLALLPFVLQVPVTAQQVPYLILLGVFHSTLAPLLYVQGFRSVRASEAAVLGYFEPVAAILLALVFLNEVPRVSALFGGAFILYSGYMILRGRAPR